MDQAICDLCGGTSIRFLFKKDGFGIVRCRDCKLVFTYPQDSSSNLQKRYSSEDYFRTSYLEKFGYGDYFAIRHLLDTWFQSRLQIIEKMVPQKGKILDIGCALGFFLFQAKQRGWETYGLERSSYAVELARRNFSLEISQETLENNSFPENLFQVVTLFDVIEHVTSPTVAFRQIHRILEPGGLLVITTPNESGLLRKVMGKHWFHFKPLEHTFFFSKETLCQYLEKAGFEIVHMQQCRKIVDIEFMINRAFHYSSHIPKIAQWISGNSHWKHKHFPLPTGEIDVFARKK